MAEELEVTFTLENNPLNAEYELNSNEEIDADFLINATGTTWGNISGTLSNQTDLQAALDLKADKTEVESVTGALADSIQAVDNKYDSITSGLDDSITAEIDNRTSADTILQSNINSLDDKVDSLTGALDDRIDTLSDTVTANYNTLDDKIDSINDALSDDIDALESVVSANYNTLSDSITAIDSTIGGYGDIVNYNAADFADSAQGALADTALQPNNNISELINDIGYITGINSGDVITALGYTPYNSTNPNNYQENVIEVIKVNNTAQTITAKTVDITVPTDTNDLTNGAGYITSASLPTVNNSTITIQKNGTTVESFTLNQSTNETVNISVPTTAADINALPDTTTINDLTTTTQQAALNSGANTTNIGQIATNTQDISDEITNRQNADNGLQSQIDALVVASDVFDIVGTYAELQAYDIDTVPVNDIIKVLVDSTHNDAATYYRCILSGGVKSWSYIGAEGAYYTKSESDNRFVPLTRTVNGKALSNNITLTASDVGALSDSTVIPTVNDSTITLQQNGTTVDSFTLNQASNKTINIETPDDYYTRNEIDSIVPQDVKTPVVYYQPTNSYCYDENDNRFYGSRVSEKLYLVQPKTSGTTQVIDMSTTFSLDFSFKYLGAPSSTFTLAEIIVSSASGKGVLLQVNSGGMYYRNNITSSTVTGTRSLVVGNTYDVRVEYNGTKMVISWKLSTDANYTQINATTCTVSGTYYNYASIGSDGDSIYLPLSSVVLVNDGTTLYDYVAGKIALDYDETLTLDSNQLSVVVDQTYDGTSANPQSGVAIEGELSTNYVKSSAEDTLQGITSSIGYINDIAPSLQLNFGTYNFSVSCGEGATLQAIDTSTGDSFAVSAIPNGLVVVQNNQQALLTLSSDSNLVINGNEVATLNDIPDTSNLANKDLSNLSATGEAKFQAPLTSGTNIKTINNTSLLGSGNIDTSEIYVATYGTTTYDELNSKVWDCPSFCTYFDGQHLPFIGIANSKFYFGAIEPSSNEILYVSVDTSNTWSTSTNNYTDTDLSNLSSTGKTVIDGQWIRAANEISNSKTVGTTSLKSNINSIIPNDGHVYELILDIVALGNGNNSCELAIQSSLCFSPWVVWAVNNVTACNRLIVPVAADRELNKIITNNAFTACSVYLSAYRRLGSNS